MSFFGKILAVFNLAALFGFIFMAARDLQMRQAWSYAVLRWDVALDGMPLDEHDLDQRGRPRYVNFGDKLSDELVGDPKILTQEMYLDHRKDVLLARIDDDKIKPAKIDKLVEVLVALTDGLEQREAIIASRSDRTPKNEEKLRNQLEARVEAIKDTKSDEKKKDKDQEAKRLAVGRALVSLVDLLPTDEEKKKRAEDPVADPVYRRTLNAVGVRTMSRVLDDLAKESLDRDHAVAEIRKDERTSFVYRHQSMIGELMNREHQLQDQKDKLKVVLDQATKLELKAAEQVQKVKDLTIAWGKKQEATAKELKKLGEEQERLYFYRLRLRDANQTNQRMEQAIRKLETEIESENP